MRVQSAEITDGGQWRRREQDDSLTRVAARLRAGRTARVVAAALCNRRVWRSCGHRSRSIDAAAGVAKVLLCRAAGRAADDRRGRRDGGVPPGPDECVSRLSSQFAEHRLSPSASRCSGAQSLRLTRRLDALCGPPRSRPVHTRSVNPAPRDATPPPQAPRRARRRRSSWSPRATSTSSTACSDVRSFSRTFPVATCSVFALSTKPFSKAHSTAALRVVSCVRRRRSGWRL